MTDAELAVLSIVAEGPIHGRDIQHVIHQRGLRAWTNIGVSSLYYVLEKLARQGLIVSHDTASDDTARRRYEITPAGVGVLQTAVADMLSTPREHASDFELGLANLHVLRPAQIRSAIVAYQQELASRLGQARERWRQLRESRAPFHVDAMFGHHVAMIEAELAWVTDFIAAWVAQAPPEPEVEPAEPEAVPRMKQVILPHDPDSPHRAPTRPLGWSAKFREPATERDTDLGLSPEVRRAGGNITPPSLATELDLRRPVDENDAERELEDDLMSAPDDALPPDADDRTHAEPGEDAEPD